MIDGARIYEFDCGHEIPQRTMDAHVTIMLSHFSHAGANLAARL